MAEIGALIGVGKQAEVFEAGELVVKLYRPGAPKDAPFREAAILAMLEPLELPAPRVSGVARHGERWGVAMTAAGGRSFAEAVIADAAAAPKYLAAMIGLHRRIHAHKVPRFTSLEARLGANLVRAALLLGKERSRRLTDALAELPRDNRLCHGDFHPYNIIGPPAAAIVVDWLDATAGHPAADVCRSFVLISHFDPEVARAYVAAYAREAGIPEVEIMAWLPVVAGARLAENVPEETDALVAMIDGV